MSLIEQYFKKISEALDPSVSVAVTDDDIERVSAMLLIEIARADHSVDKAEREVISKALRGSSSLPVEELDNLVEEAMQEAEAAHSLHQHVSIINDKFSKQDKIHLVEQMWRVAMADGDIDRYEDYTIRKLCDLLYIKHRDFMQAKHRVQAESS